MKINKRIFEDWENASQKIFYISNDLFFPEYAKNEFLWLAKLTIYIESLCDSVNKSDKSIDDGLNITMLSRLWVLHAYEIIRTLDEADRCKNDGKDKCLNSNKKSYCDTCRKFNTERFTKLKQKLANIRIPIAKLRPKNNELPRA